MLGDLKDWQISNAKIADNINIPSNVDEAYNEKNWREAMEEELDSLKRHEVWDVIECPENAKIVKSKWVFNIKRDN